MCHWAVPSLACAKGHAIASWGNQQLPNDALKLMGFSTVQHSAVGQEYRVHRAAQPMATLLCPAVRPGVALA